MLDILKYKKIDRSTWKDGDALPTLTDGRLILPKGIGTVIREQLKGVPQPLSYRDKFDILAILHDKNQRGIDSVEIRTELDHALAIRGVFDGNFVVDTGRFYVNVGKPVGKNEYLSRNEDGTWCFENIHNATPMTENEIYSVVPKAYRDYSFFEMEELAQENANGVSSSVNGETSIAEEVETATEEITFNEGSGDEETSDDEESDLQSSELAQEDTTSVSPLFSEVPTSEIISSEEASHLTSEAVSEIEEVFSSPSPFMERGSESTSYDEIVSSRVHQDDVHIPEGRVRKINILGPNVVPTEELTPEEQEVSRVAGAKEAIRAVKFTK